MALLTLAQAQLSYGDVALLDDAQFSLEAKERVGLIGRNGAGKSSLLKILAGLEKADDGVLHVQKGVRMAYLPQEPELAAEDSVATAVQRAIAPLLAMVERYTQGECSADELTHLQTEIDAQEGWTLAQRLDETLQRLHLHADMRVGDLSGGNKKRVALAQALVTRPDVLLLDEPTNHLDLDSILWLEELLLGFKGAIIVITHDRTFLDRVATRIVELDRGELRSYLGNFAKYQVDKAAQLEQEIIINAKADKLLAQEEVWIRKGVEARRTRAVARIGRLEKLRAQRAARRDAVGRVKLDIDTGAASGKIVAELQDFGFCFAGRNTATESIVQGLTTTILRGDKVGLIGPNGAGKTTLLKLILGIITPVSKEVSGTFSGKLRTGANLQVAYFDQMRAALDPNATLEDFISPGSEWIEIDGARKHVKSYLSDFLFSPARANSPIRSLSGGERNRLLLARLFARPANVLVLDEPTNDLDMDTLELLEELLQSYSGTVFLVSHDRAFVNNVVTSTLVWEGQAQWREFEGDLDDWLLQSARSKALADKSSKADKGSDKSGNTSTPNATSSAPASTTPSASANATSPKRKLSYKEQRELDSLPQQIAALEAEQAAIKTELAQGTVYANDATRAAALHQRDAEIEEALLHCLERWETLGA